MGYNMLLAITNTNYEHTNYSGVSKYHLLFSQMRMIIIHHSCTNTILFYSDNYCIFVIVCFIMTYTLYTSQYRSRLNDLRLVNIT